MLALYYKNRTKDSIEESRDGLSGTWWDPAAAKSVMTEGPKYRATLQKKAVLLWLFLPQMFPSLC